MAYLVKCKFRQFDEIQYSGGFGIINFGEYFFEGEDYKLVDFFRDNNYDNFKIDYNPEKNSILITKNGNFSGYYDCIHYEKTTLKSL